MLNSLNIEKGSTPPVYSAGQIPALAFEMQTYFSRVDWVSKKFGVERWKHNKTGQHIIVKFGAPQHIKAV
jgi:hypothetical protein